MEAKRHSPHLGRSGRREHQIFCQFLSFFLLKTISSQTETFCYKLTRWSHHFFPAQTDTDVNSLKKIMVHNAASSKINFIGKKIQKHFLNALGIRQQCKLNLFAENQRATGDIGFSAYFLQSRSLLYCECSNYLLFIRKKAALICNSLFCAATRIQL